MNKEELLAKSRVENKRGDERQQVIIIKKIVVVTISFCFLVLLILNQYFARSLPILSAICDVIAVLILAESGIKIYTYIKDKDKSLFYDLALNLFLIIWWIIDIVRDII